VNNYDGIQGRGGGDGTGGAQPLWQPIEGDLINLQIDIKHCDAAFAQQPNIIQRLIKHLTQEIECRSHVIGC